MFLMRRSELRERIRDGLERVWHAHGRSFLTIEDAGDEERFVQFLDGQLNVAWPFDDDPAELLPRRRAAPPAGVRVLSWRPGGTFVAHTGDLRLDETAEWVARLLERVLDVDDVAVRVEADR